MAHLSKAIPAATIAALLSFACDDEIVAPPTAPSNATAAPTAISTPVPTPTRPPVTRRESVTFPAGSIDVQGTAFDVGGRGSVEVGVGCHADFAPFQLVKVDVLAGGGQRVASQRCGPASPTCTDIGMTLDLDPGNYVVRLERHANYRTWVGYMCDVTVTAP